MQAQNLLLNDNEIMVVESSQAVKKYKFSLFFKVSLLSFCLINNLTSFSQNQIFFSDLDKSEGKNGIYQVWCADSSLYRINVYSNDVLESSHFVSKSGELMELRTIILKSYEYNNYDSISKKIIYEIYDRFNPGNFGGKSYAILSFTISDNYISNLRLLKDVENRCCGAPSWAVFGFPQCLDFLCSVPSHNGIEFVLILEMQGFCAPLIKKETDVRQGHSKNKKEKKSN